MKITSSIKTQDDNKIKVSCRANQQNVTLHFKHDHQYRSTFKSVNIHLLTGYEDNRTCNVPKVPTIVRANTQDNIWYRGDNTSDITRISSL